jgi:hypothetical protein
VRKLCVFEVALLFSLAITLLDVLRHPIELVLIDIDPFFEIFDLLIFGLTDRVYLCVLG